MKKKRVKDTRGVCVCELLQEFNTGKTRCEKPPNQPWFTVTTSYDDEIWESAIY